MVDEAENVIRFQAQTFKVQTLQSGGWRLTLDGWDKSILGKLADTQQPGILLEVAAVPIMVDKLKPENDADKPRKPRY